MMNYDEYVNALKLINLSSKGLNYHTINGLDA